MHLPFTLSRSGGEVGVFDRTRCSEETGKPVLYGPEDAVWYGPLPAGTVYGRKDGGRSEDFERRTQ
jgi:spore coat protein H